MPHISKDAKKVREFSIETYKKGFSAISTVEGITVQEYFQFQEIRQIIHYPDAGVEIVGYNGSRRVFYNDSLGEAQILFDSLNSTMLAWMDTNLN